MSGRITGAVYDSDTARIVKDDFEELYRQKKSILEITNLLVEQYCPQLSAQEMEEDFWLPLACAQWDWGVLLPEVKDRALAILQHKEDAMFWDARERLYEPTPAPKKIRKRRSYRCWWNNGDVFAWKLRSEQAIQMGLVGRYLLLQKVDICYWYPSHFIPICYAKLTKDDRIPTTAEEFDVLEYIKTDLVTSPSMAYPIDFRNGDREAMKQFADSLTPAVIEPFEEYRFSLITTSQKDIPNDLVFVGNLVGSKKPTNEYIPPTHINISAFHWSKFGKTFEEGLLNKYRLYNLKQHGYYNGTNDTSFRK